MKQPSLFLDLYKKDSIESLRTMNPEWDEHDLEDLIDDEISKHLSNPSVIIDNNFKRKTQSSTLLTIMDWAIKEEPLIAGNGTFYMNQHEAVNPVASMLDMMLKKRKAYKKQMFGIKDPNSQAYKDLDLLQANMKINANSYYGASGMPASCFFSKWSGGATTSTCQSVISTCYSTFEAFIADNFLFIDLTECIHWLNCVVEQISEDSYTEKWINRKSIYDVFDKLKGMFIDWDDEYEQPLFSYLTNLSSNELTRIYYRNRLQEFTSDHPYVMELHRTIIDKVNIYPVLTKAEMKRDDWESLIPPEFRGRFDDAEKYNSFACNEAFMDPNDIPKSIENEVKELGSLYMKYVYTQYLVFDRIYRLKNLGRKSVVIIDTDSNILALDEWMEFALNNFANESNKPKENIEFILINTITYTLTEVITDILLKYGECSNIPEEFRPRFNMKNELTH